MKHFNIYSKLKLSKKKNQEFVVNLNERNIHYFQLEFIGLLRYKTLPLSIGEPHSLELRLLLLVEC